MRDDRGQVRCFYNVCRHRGTRICEESCGRFAHSIQCPYHAWTYDLRGDLQAAPHMAGVEGFDRKDYSLHSVPCVVWQGFVFINVNPGCAAFESTYRSILSRFDEWGLEGLVSAHQTTYTLKANWKVVFQNYSECYHCSLVHPQLTPVTSVKTASNDFEDGPFLGGPMVLSDSHDTVSTGGALCGDRLAGLSGENHNRVYFYTLFPSLFVSLHPDYVLIHRIERLGVDATRIACDWLFPQEVIDRSDFDPSRAVELWDLTNRQDWHVCELTYQGLRSDAYRPGPYSHLESILAAFDRHYLQVMGSRVQVHPVGRAPA